MKRERISKKKTILKRIEDNRKNHIFIEKSGQKKPNLVHVDLIMASKEDKRAALRIGGMLNIKLLSDIGRDNPIINLDAQITAGETVVPVAATTGFVPGAADVPTLLCLLIDPTVADSELVRAVSFDSGVSVTIMEAVKRTHVTTTSYLANVAKTYAFDLPLGTVRARVIYDNEYDTAGSGIYTRTRITKTTVL